MHQNGDGGKEPGVGKKNPVDPAESGKRSWIQRRMCDLYMEANGPDLTGKFNQSEWSPFYRQAERDWEEQNATPEHEPE